MTILLLISVGSVCASENITADNDAELTSAEADVVLEEEPSDDVISENGTGEDTTPQETINTTITVESEKEKFSYDEDKNFTVTVKDNESKDVENITSNNLTVYEGNKSIGFTYNNSILSITDKLAVGNHSLIINYLGNANYTNSSFTFLLKILGNKTLEAPSTVVSDGNTIEIPNVKVFDGVDYLAISKDGLTLNLTYTDKNGNISSIIISDFNLENGTISFNKNIEFVAASISLNYTDAVNTKDVIIKLGTSVNANDAKIRDTEDKNITVNIVDGQNNPLNITKSDLKILENGKEVNFDYNNSIITIKSLAIGEHALTITFIGNQTYNESSKKITVKIWGNQTINPQKTAYIDEGKWAEIYLNLTDGVDLVNVDLSKLKVTLFYKQGNSTQNVTLMPADIVLGEDNQTIKIQVTEAFDTAYANIAYAAAENNLTAKVTLKVKTTINSEDPITKGTDEKIEFNIIVTGSDGNKINVTANKIQVLNNDKAVKFEYNNSVITLTDKFTYGTYNFTIKYLGDDTYGESTSNRLLTVYGINATSSINVNSTKKGEVNITIINGNETVNITKEDISLNVTYKVDNDTKTIEISEYTFVNGTISFTLADGNFTTATLTITYNNSTKNVTINRIYNVKIEAVTISNEYKSGNFTFKITDIDDASVSLKGKSVSLYTTGNIRAGFTGTIDENNMVNYRTRNLYIFDQSSGSFEMKELTVGKYAVEISTSNPLISTSLKVNLTITKANINIVIDKFKEEYGTTKKVKITVTNAKTGEAVSGIILKLSMPQTSGKTYYFQTNTNGTSEITVSQLVGGTYDMTVQNNDTKNINKKTVKGSITITPKPVVITAKSFTMRYNSGTTQTIKITDKKTGKAINGAILLVKFDNNKKKTYLVQTNSKGIFKLSSIPGLDLAVGKHKMTISTADTRYKGSTVTKTITVKKASAKITAKKVTAYYKGGKYFTVKVTNKQNKHAIYNAKVNIKIFVSKNRFYNYSGSTGTNGVIKLSLNNLKPGSYKVVVSGIDSKNFAAKKVNSKIVVKKAPTKFISKKLTAKKGAKKYFKVTAKNKKTKKVIKGIKIKIKVYTGKKYKTYTVKTNKKGIAQISTKSLKVGTHKVVIKSANKYCVAKTTKSSIKITKK